MTQQSKYIDLIEKTRPNVKEINIEESLEKISKGALLVDIREDREWFAGHAQGAIHIGKGVLERDIAHKCDDSSKEIILYCGGGVRSILAADMLQKMGYQKVYSMIGGWRAWVEMNLPVEQD